MEKLLFTSESVTEGHPDKLCDAVSDAILDACIQQDPMSRVACETASCTGFILVTGEITTKAQLDIPAIVRKTALEIGYDDGKKGLDGNSCAVMVSIDKQSADIAMGVDKALEAKRGRTYRQPRHRSRRSGNDVWICYKRDQGVHAIPNRTRSQACIPAHKG